MKVLTLIGGSIVILLIIILLIGATIGLEFIGLERYKYFEPKKEDAKRKVFENTKSYIHGKIQDLAERYDEYNKATEYDDKQAIAEMVKMEFANFDEKKIKNDKLYKFLIDIRGY